MEIYENENDQLEAVKRFFVENGKALAVGIILGIGGLVGWRYWNEHKIEVARSSSLAYDHALSDLRADKPEALVAVEKYIADNKNSYSALASLEVAQHLVNSNELEKAAAQLQQGLTATQDDDLKAVISMRLSRIQSQLNQFDAALKTLDTIKGEGWSAILANLRGEYLLRKGDKQGARAEWEKGVKSNASSALSEMMQMKINNLSI